jgi:hypothetical protein
MAQIIEHVPCKAQSPEFNSSIEWERTKNRGEGEEEKRKRKKERHPRLGKHILKTHLTKDITEVLEL